MTTITLKMAMFFFIANLIMVFIVEFKSAEFYITIFSMILMLILIILMRIRIAKMGDNE